MKHTILEHAAVEPELETRGLNLPSGQLNTFFPILQKGVTVPATVGCTLKSLLCDQLAIPTDYVADRITTIFVDNRPIDDLDCTIVQNDSRVTLSAAMPGLVGATMRRGGYYAALRQGISHIVERGAATSQRGTIRLKLFNLLLAEIGPLILAHGLILEQDELTELLGLIPARTAKPPASSGRVLLTIICTE